ncbi:alcohol dehydrogenase catalytic domain-containing protein [Bradyrhizobium sp. 2TAF24]|uniref:alcohol dehydrogenase catalytic domain-containing protein n=1 Tax=Bradyrhizobium sp. 2TAF24 TaxID=3233011 RepID=UPI003F8F4DA2
MSIDTRSVFKEAAAPRSLGLRRQPIAALGPHDVLVRIHSASICGTDLHIYKWNEWAAHSYRPPLPLGHEFGGTVVGTGAAVTRVHAGDIVSAETHLPCGECRQCRLGRGHTCDNLRLFSRMGLGCFADHTVVPEALLRLVPDGIAVDFATMMEPLGVSVRAVTEVSVTGANVLVVGCGPIGLFAVAAARAYGAGRIMATDLAAYRRALAQRLGADVVADPARQSLGDAMPAQLAREKFDVVIETSGSEQAFQDALAQTRKGGDIVFASLPERSFSIDMARHVILGEITLRGVYGRRLDQTWLQVETLLRTHGPQLAQVMTHRLPLADFDAAFALAASGEAGKVVLQP